MISGVPSCITLSATGNLLCLSSTHIVHQPLPVVPHFFTMVWGTPSRKLEQSVLSSSVFHLCPNVQCLDNHCFICFFFFLLVALSRRASPVLFTSSWSEVQEIYFKVLILERMLIKIFLNKEIAKEACDLATRY